MKPLFAAVAFGLAVLASGSAEGVARDPRASARAKYAKQSAAPLGTVEPVTISRAVFYKDGGTSGLELTDAARKKHAFSLFSPGDGPPGKDGPPEGIPNLFVGASHPTFQGARKAEVRGPEEAALYGVLLRTIDKEKDAILGKDVDVKACEARKLFGTGLVETRTFFHRLEGHFLKE